MLETSCLFLLSMFSWKSSSNWDTRRAFPCLATASYSSRSTFIMVRADSLEAARVREKMLPSRLLSKLPSHMFLVWPMNSSLMSKFQYLSSL